MKNTLDDVRVSDLRDARGAAAILAQREGKESISVERVHVLVRAGKLQAYKFNGAGVLVEHQRGEGRSTESLFFIRGDVERVELPMSNRGRPRKQS